MDTFKNKAPFAVTLGCIRGSCSCEALDLGKTAYQSFSAEIAKRAEIGLPIMPDVEVIPDTPEEKPVPVEPVVHVAEAQKPVQDAPKEEIEEKATEVKPVQTETKEEVVAPEPVSTPAETKSTAVEDATPEPVPVETKPKVHNEQSTLVGGMVEPEAVKKDTAQMSLADRLHEYFDEQAK